jgi:riboflavin synthase
LNITISPAQTTIWRLRRDLDILTTQDLESLIEQHQLNTEQHVYDVFTVEDETQESDQV